MTAAVETGEHKAEYMRIPPPTTAADAGVQEKVFPDDPDKERAYWMAKSMALNAAAKHEPALHVSNPFGKDATVDHPKVEKLLDGQAGTLHAATELLAGHFASINDAPDMRAQGPEVGRQVIDLFTRKAR